MSNRLIGQFQVWKGGDVSERATHTYHYFIGIFNILVYSCNAYRFLLVELEFLFHMTRLVGKLEARY